MRAAFATACMERWGPGGTLRVNEPLAKHGTFAVGGTADVWLSAAHEDDLLTLLALAREHGGAPVLFAGNGTNVLYADAGARGAVARVSLEHWELRQTDSDDTIQLVAGAGVSLPKLVNELARQGWAGLEWGAGVPGTIGGAVVSNAGCHGMCVGDTLQSARVLDATAGVIRECAATELGLAYRHSRFRAGRQVAFDAEGRLLVPARVTIDPVEVITGATFLLRRDAPGDLQARVAYFKQYRRDTQPPQPSAGSVFKNPPGDHAGRLVEAAGLKGYQIGGAAISAKHANFIVNLGGGSAADIVALITRAYVTVREQFGIALDLEVEPRGDW